MVPERRVAHLVVGNRKGEHRQAGVHDLAHDPVLGLLVEPRRRVHHAGIETVVALLDAGVRRGIGQAGARDAQPTHRHRADATRENEPGTRLVVVVLADERRPFAESVGQPCIDLGCFDHVRVTRVVPHRSLLRPLVRWRASSTSRGQQYQRPHIGSRAEMPGSMCSLALVVQSCRHACIGMQSLTGPSRRLLSCRRSRTDRRARPCIGPCRQSCAGRGVIPLTWCCQGLNRPFIYQSAPTRRSGLESRRRAWCALPPRHSGFAAGDRGLSAVERCLAEVVARRPETCSHMPDDCRVEEGRCTGHELPDGRVLHDRPGLACARVNRCWCWSRQGAWQSASRWRGVGRWSRDLRLVSTGQG